MRSFRFPLTQYIDKGLSLANNARNNPLLSESIGAFPYQGTLEAVEEFTRIDTSGLPAHSFPYPQIFVISNTVVVCLEDAIYETTNGVSYTLKISGLTVGTLWSLVDFKTYIVLMNGATAVQKVHDTGVYEVVSYGADKIPHGETVCNFNGHILIGSPEV